MATKPTSYPEWAVNEETEVKLIDGKAVSFVNKIEPSEEWKLSGALYNENTPRQYINYQFNNINAWITHLDERVAVGDFYLAKTAETAGNMNTRFGGTWADRGTDSIAGQTVRLFERTA